MTRYNKKQRRVQGVALASYLLIVAFAGLSFGMWNVRTSHRDYSLDVLTQEFQHYNLDVLGLQETRWKGKGEVIGFADFHFIIEPQDTIVIKDSEASLTCSATGSPPPVIEWKREGTVLQFAGDIRRQIFANGSLYFQSVVHTRTERPDEGVYQCTATIKDIGTIVSHSAKLQIASLPRFDQQPQDTTLYLGQTVYFPCSIQGIPPATITWLKDEHPLQIDRSRMTVLPSGALEIDYLKVTDGGTYRCNASNIEKFRLSTSGTLIVALDYAEGNKIFAPYFIATPPKSSVIVDGNNLTLDCAANGNPKPKISWLKDGTTIDIAHLDSRFRIVGAGSLQIENIHEGDEGIFMCRAENHEDSLDASSTVDVHVPPRFVKKPQNKYAYEKEDIEFECEVYGRPLPTVQWIKNGDIIIQSEYFQIVNGYNLKILGLVKSDKGIYQCIASNPAGNIQSSVQLIILDPGNQPHSKDVPSAPRELAAVIVSTRFVTLSWKEPVRTNGDIFAYSLYYREEGSTRERVLNTTRLRLEEVSIQSLRPSTQYFFRVVAYNQHGPGQSSDEVAVETQAEVHVPSSSRNLQAIPYSATSILVEWQPPDVLNGPIERYKLYYMEVGTSEEHEVSTPETSYVLHGLKKFTEYNFWVVAFNQNGPGLSTEEVTVQTYADVPSEMPQNVTLEAASSTSIIVRWEPPPKESQNGIITGYKIRYKLKGSRRGETVTTDGKRRLYALIGLERGAQYSVKIAALSVNGSGPSTEWMTVDTYQNDLDESKVPDQPSSLRARPSALSIFVSWGPPRNQNIMIRGYTIGWGVGFPDVYTKVLDGKQRYYTIENLQPSSEYVISLRAFNQVGDGRPIYETVKTLIETTPEPLTPMLPPVGLKAIVLSSTTVVLYWTDTTLPRNQLITDSRYYTVRYTSYSYSSNPKYRYFNSTDLNCMLDDLKPNTQYEFSVKVVKGRRESTWSMSVLNTTQEAAPSSPPRDLTVFASEDDSSHINLHWQPPKQPNGQITGYVIFYTTDNTQRDRDWVVEGVVGDKMTTVLKGLTLDTTYYFKIQARNNKGYGPLSSEVVFHTTPGLSFEARPAFDDVKGLTNSMLYIIIACVSGITIMVIIVVSTIICRRRHGYLGAVRKKSYGAAKSGATKGKCLGKELKPPDLWIHHDQMELKSMEKSNNAETNMTVTPIPRNSQELGDEPLLNTLEKKKSSYTDSLSRDQKINADKHLLKCQVRATPIMISLDACQPTHRNSVASTVSTPNGGMNQNFEVGPSGMSRPLYPRTQYNIPRAHVAGEVPHTGLVADPSPASTSQQITTTYEQIGHIPPSQTPNLTVGNTTSVGFNQLSCYPQVSVSTGNAAQTESSITGTLTKRPPGHPLKSFSVPAPPPQSAPSTPQPKHLASKPQLVASPHKKVIVSANNLSSDSIISNPCNSSQQSTLKSRPGVSVIPARSSDTTSTLPKEELGPSYSTEELNQEMANLEGLMKDLNAITASEFEC